MIVLKVEPPWRKVNLKSWFTEELSVMTQEVLESLSTKLNKERDSLKPSCITLPIMIERLIPIKPERYNFS